MKQSKTFWILTSCLLLIGLLMIISLSIASATLLSGPRIDSISQNLINLSNIASINNANLIAPTFKTQVGFDATNGNMTCGVASISDKVSTSSVASTTFILTSDLKYPGGTTAISPKSLQTNQIDIGPSQTLSAAAITYSNTNHSTISSADTLIVTDGTNTLTVTDGNIDLTNKNLTGFVFLGTDMTITGFPDPHGGAMSTLFLPGINGSQTGSLNTSLNQLIPGFTLRIIASGDYTTNAIDDHTQFVFCVANTTAVDHENDPLEIIMGNPNGNGLTLAFPNVRSWDFNGMLTINSIDTNNTAIIQSAGIFTMANPDFTDNAPKQTIYKQTSALDLTNGLQLSFWGSIRISIFTPRPSMTLRQICIERLR